VEAADRNGYHRHSVVHWFTHEEASHAGLESENSSYSRGSDKHPHHSNGYYFQSTLTKESLEWDAVRAHAVDMMHQLANFGRAMIHWMANKFSGVYTPAIHREEMRRRRDIPHVEDWQPAEGDVVKMDEGEDESKQSAADEEDNGDDEPIDQFTADGHYGAKGGGTLPRQPWQLTKADQNNFDKRCEEVRLPFRDTRLPALINRDRAGDFQIKSAHWLIFLGPVGIWLLLGCPSLAPEFLDVFCDAIWWCHQITAKDFQRDELAYVEESGHQIFTRLELRLPLKAATLARHYLSHACQFIRSLGPLHTHWQYPSRLLHQIQREKDLVGLTNRFPAERFNKALGDMVKSYKNPMVGHP
jgi:hypothetical protein